MQEKTIYVFAVLSLALQLNCNSQFGSFTRHFYVRLPNGITIHRRFGMIPGMDPEMNCNIDAGSTKAKLIEVIEKSKEILKLPKDYYVGIIAASDTGAVEAAMWNLLGPNGVEVLAWESFGLDWAKTITDQLKINGANVHKADYGKLPNLGKVNFSKDVLLKTRSNSTSARLDFGQARLRSN